jgi:hypothetical protein
MKTNEEGRACKMYGRRGKVHTEFSRETEGVNGIIILKWILQK